jgi:penicillin-binding protein 2D
VSLIRCLLILTIVLLLSLSGSFGYLVYTIVELQELPPVTNALATRIYDQDDNLITLRYVENRIEVPLEQISDHLIKATVAVEDKHYYQHLGFDLSGVGRAILNNLQKRQVDQGGSTITQQLAKNLYLSHERTFARKVREAIYTIHLERTHSKSEILEKYLNTIYYGHAAYGAEAAAQTYFGKSAASLTLAESALLAGLPRGPFYYSPFIDEAAAIRRQKIVLSQMAACGIIGEVEKEAALAEKLLFREPSGEESAAYFLDYVINVELASLFKGDLTPVYHGGLQIFTTLDPEMQLLAQQTIASIPQQHFSVEGTSQPQGALVAIDPVTGYVKAMVGGRDFNETKVNRVSSLRSVGSSFKPFVYAAALECGFTVSTKVLCAPVVFNEPGLSEPYEPTDFGGSFHHRELSYREALTRSCNIAAIKTHVAIGREKAVEMAARLGISRSLGAFYSLPLGTVEISLLELTAAYAAFANGGYRVEPVLIRTILDANGKVILENHPRREKVLDEKVAFLITDMLKDVVAEGGTASQVSAILTHAAAGKSGTSQDSKNAHMIGYTPALAAGLYIGDDHETPLKATAGQLAAPLWARFMDEALRGTPPRDFTLPEGIIRVPLCPETGLQSSSLCAEPAQWEYFIEGSEPEMCHQCSPLPIWLRPLAPWISGHH